MLAVFWIVAGIGADEAASNRTVLGFLDPLVALVSQSGKAAIDSLFGNRTWVGWATTVTALAIALVALVNGPQRTSPVQLLSAAVTLATWGQILLLSERTLLGIWLYVGGVACALVLGVWRPFSRLDRAAPPPLSARMHWTVKHPVWECALVLVLTLAGLLVRLYAVTEIPGGFDLETVDFMIMSRTLHGLRQYTLYSLMANNNGVFHLLTQTVLFHLFGTSLYTVRLAAVFWGAAAIPLLYWLVRRMFGVWPAIVSTLFILAGPEQLYWSRSENSFFAPVGVAALITVHLGWWMAERLSPAAVLTTALWMPVSRFFYTPCIILVAYPLVVYCHSVVFVKGAWRTASYAVPLLVAGLLLWTLSLSTLLWVTSREWRFIHPAYVHGAAVWRKHGEGSLGEGGLAELARNQAGSAMAGLREVIQGMTDTGPRMFSHYYVRYDPSSEHRTVITAGFAVIVALGIGYLLGQCYERRAFALLALVCIGLLPGILSNEPSPRRIALVFPALYAIGGVMIDAAARIVRARAQPSLAWFTSGALAVAVAGVVWASLASHLIVGKSLPYFEDRIRFSTSVFEESDVILHNLDNGLRDLLVLGNLDRFVSAPPCYRHVETGEWTDATLSARCRFTDPVYGLIFPKERVDELERAHDPRRISYLLEETPYSRPQIELLRRLYPSAIVRRLQSNVGARTLVHVSIDRSAVQALHAPSLASNGVDESTLKKTLLSGVTLTPTASTAAGVSHCGEIVVRGGLQLEHDGWYRFEVTPACPAAMLTLDNWTPSNQAHPMQAGIHSFRLALPSSHTCRLPLQLLAQSQAHSSPVPLDASFILSPTVAEMPELQTAPVLAYAGHGEARVLAQISGAVIDFGVDGEGRISVLAEEAGAFRVQRLNANGQEEARWFPRVPQGRSVVAIAVEPSGGSILMAETHVLSFDDGGKESAAWATPWEALATDLALTPDGQVLLAVPDRGSIAVFTRDGAFRGELMHFDGGPGTLFRPTTVIVEGSNMLVIQDDGRALLFRIGANVVTATFVRTFEIDFSNLPVHPLGGALADDGMIVVPDVPTGTPLVYNFQGERMMAAVPTRDLSTKGLGQVVQLQVRGDQLYAIDRSNGRIWSVMR